MPQIKQVSFTSPYDAEAQEIERRRALAQALSQQASQPLPTNRMAGRVAIPIHPLEGLAQLAKGASGAYGSAQASQQAKDLSGRRSAALAEELRRMPQASQQAMPSDQEGTGAFDMMGSASPAQRTVQPSMAQNSAWLGQLAGIGPDAVSMGGTMLGMQQRSAENAENRAARTQDKILQLEAAAQNLALAREDRAKAATEAAALRREMQASQQSFAAQQAEAQRQFAGQQNQLARDARQPPAPTMTEVIDPSDPTRMLRVDAKLYKGGTLGSVGVLGISGKEPVAAKRSEKEDQGKELLKSELDNLREHYRVLNDARAIPSTERGTGSNVASWVQGSGAGQLLGRMGGTKEQKARDEIQSARLRVLNAIKNATGMSAQQLNSNVELKTWLDSMTSMQGSYEANVGIIDAIEKAFLKGPQRRASDKVPPPKVVDW